MALHAGSPGAAGAIAPVGRMGVNSQSGLGAVTGQADIPLGMAGLANRHVSSCFTGMGI